MTLFGFDFSQLVTSNTHSHIKISRSFYLKFGVYGTTPNNNYYTFEYKLNLQGHQRLSSADNMRKSLETNNNTINIKNHIFFSFLLRICCCCCFFVFFFVF